MAYQVSKSKGRAVTAPAKGDAPGQKIADSAPVKKYVNPVLTSGKRRRATATRRTWGRRLLSRALRTRHRWRTSLSASMRSATAGTILRTSFERGPQETTASI